MKKEFQEHVGSKSYLLLDLLNATPPHTKKKKKIKKIKLKKKKKSENARPRWHTLILLFKIG